MPDLIAGRPIRAADWPAAVVAHDDTDINDITTTSYAAGSPEVAVTFVAPTSGRVVVTVAGTFKDDGGSNRVFVSCRITETDGSGAQLFGPDAGLAAAGMSDQADGNMIVSRTFLIEDLTPYGVYYAQVRHRVTGGSTADISSRTVAVVPVA